MRNPVTKILFSHKIGKLILLKFNKLVIIVKKSGMNYLGKAVCQPFADTTVLHYSPNQSVPYFTDSISAIVKALTLSTTTAAR